MTKSCVLKIGLLLSVAVFSGSALAARAAPPVAAKGQLASCDFNPGHAAAVSMAADKASYSPGEPVLFRGTVKNISAFPLPDTGVLVRVFRNRSGQAKKASPIIVHEFYLAKHLGLAPGAERRISGGWALNPKAPPGDYSAAFYAVAGEKFALGGFPSSDFAAAAYASFSVGGKNPETPYLDRAGAKVNGGAAETAGPPTNPRAPIAVSIPLVNPGAADDVAVRYRLFFGYAAVEQNLIGERTETVAIPHGASKTLSYRIEQPAQSAYYLEITATPKRQALVNNPPSTFANISIPGSASAGRVLFAGVRGLSGKSGEAPEFFACFSGSDSFEGRFAAVFRPKSGAESALDVAGGISGKLQGVKTGIQPSAGTNEGLIEVALFDSNDRVLDAAELSYDCSLFDPKPCFAKAVAPPGPPAAPSRKIPAAAIWGAAGFLLAAFVVFTVIKVRRINARYEADASSGGPTGSNDSDMR